MDNLKKPAAKLSAKMRRIHASLLDRSDSRWIAAIGIAMIVLFNWNHFDLSHRQQDTRRDLATVSGQAQAIATTQAAGMVISAGDRLADSVERVAMLSAIGDLRVALEKSKDSTRLAERLNVSLNAVFLAQRKSADGLYFSRLQRVQDAGNRQSKRTLDSIRTEVSGLKAAVSDSVLTARLAAAAFREIYRTASLKNKWFSSELMFGKDSAGKDQASVVPLFKNSFDVDITGYVPPKKGVAGSVSFNVTESNIYAQIGSQNFEKPIPALKGRKKASGIRQTKQNTRRTQRKRERERERKQSRN